MKLRVCIVGGSGHYGYVLESLSDEFDIVAVSPGVVGENLAPLLSKFKQACMDPRLYEDYRQMLKSERPDVVVINTHFYMNGKILLQALQMGIHAFVEKPIATNLEDLHQIEKIYSEVKDKVFFAAMFGLRYKPWFLTAKNLVDSNAVGEIRLIHAQKSYKLGERPEFFRKRETFGGTLAWVGIHAIDWIHWISNKRFVSVYGLHSRMANKNHGELEATGACLFELEQEVIATLTVDYLRPPGAETHDDDRLRIVGTEGILEVRDQSVLLTDEDGTRVVQNQEQGYIFKDFLNHVLGRGRCMVTAEQSIYATYIALKAREAADERRIVTL
ncbi:oxidoreductase [Thermotoga sp. Ku-13t]|uniref:Gfo/Idh/MocA family protein n=1 Tax=Thermotoga sp. Ku-13t TaxID=1755813 RepID=UPI0013EB929C|nr:Gfo/Idh/MocA family oxidoreductase [Thermotoga sp. Ku-13t]KAF2958424.1 oxidoreductase [Thermotoga sp. Ku-13t]